MLTPIPIATFLLTTALLGIVQAVVAEPRLLLADRFFPGAGWAEAAALAVYAAFVARLLADPKKVSRVRPRIWRLFSLVFFTQLLLGLCGLERCLMTGKLHLPIPALIVAGPLYRGHGLFMMVLFLVTIVLVGPAWCSHLCYIGSWDDWAARRQKRPRALPRWRTTMRIGIFGAVVAIALGLGALGADPVVAGALALAFGLGGVALMGLWSRRTGAMAHCTTYCPISLLADGLGKISPFRLRIAEGCNQCGICSRACRYDALSEADIQRRRPGLTCTLCGDCVASCHSKLFAYRFPGLSPAGARGLFVVLVASLHALFLGVARL
jgi:polyferredoxin